MKRLSYIDVLRGTAIILIVFGHVIVHSSHCYDIYKFIYSFHVSLFFIISGFTFNDNKTNNFYIFFKKKSFRILIPYFFWASVFLIPYMLFGRDVGNIIGTNSTFEFKSQLGNILYGIGYDNALKQNTPLWFLPALFTVEIFFYFIIKYTKDKDYKVHLLFAFLFFIIGYLSTFITIKFPFGINTLLTMGIFFYSGYLLKKYSVFDKIKLNDIVIFLFFIIGIIISQINGEIGYMNYNYSNYPLFIMSSIHLSMVLFYLSKKIKLNNIIEQIGKNTIGILIFHKIIIVLIQTKAGIVSVLLRNSNALVEIMISIIATSITIICSMICTIIIKRLAPFLLGEKKGEKKA